MNNRSHHGPFDFIDRLGDLFHHSEEAPPAPSQDPLASLSEQFESALLNLERTIDQRRKEMEGQENHDWRGRLKAEAEEEKKKREVFIHRKIREDIESAHTELGTDLSTHDIVRYREYLQKADLVVSEGAQSHEVLPRCRQAILRRIHREAGVLALKEMDGRLREHGQCWPETVPRDPSISPEESDEIRKRKRLEFREDFANYSIRRSSFLIVGIVEAWKSDYPDSATPLWRSVVLEGVATALRARRMHLFSDRLREDRALIEARAAELVGGEVARLNQTLRGGLTSLNDAHRVVTSSLKILDEIIPGLAWKHLQEVLPEARGERTPE